MPNVVIDLRMVRGRLHGIGRYALELARRLPALAPSWRFVGLTAPGGLPDVGPLRPDMPLLPCTSGFLSWREQLDLPRALRDAQADLFHATSFSVPRLWSGRLVVTLHDANHWARPEDYGWKQSLYLRTVTGPRARHAEAILTVSDFSREELSRFLNVPPERIHLTPPGVDTTFRPKPSRLPQLPQQYFAAVGNEKPFKNLSLLAKIASRLPYPICLLAGAGAAKRLGFDERTIDLGTLPESDLPAFYAGATALLLPSRYEGFGLPALEAMACGTPVLAARAGALPEVLQRAGVLVSPDDSEAWVDEATRLANDLPHRRSLSALGLARAQDFSWDSCAQKTLGHYRAILERATA
ncbi:MAG: glycosyltransferase family 4 protein [Myxococcaceae bacterium]